MAPTVSVPIYQTIYRLGALYASYRLTIAFSLILIFLITLENQAAYYGYPNLYFYALIVFAGFGIVQILALKFYPHGLSRQFIAIFFIDVIFLSSLTFALNGPNLLIGLLFVITIFAANFLLAKNTALLLTLVAVISIVYQQFLGSFLDNANLNNIGNSALLAFLFFVVYGIGQVAIRHFQVLDSLNTLQSLELFKLQNINRYILEQIEVGYLVFDDKFKIIVSNPAACTLLGIPALYAHEHYHLAKFQPDLFKSIQTTALKNGERFQFESQHSSYCVDIRVQKLIVPQQALTLLVLEDTQKINQQVQQLKLASLGQLSASIAHEIRNPLAAIVQANDLILGSDEVQQQYLNQMIHKQAQRIDAIIQDTLNMAKNKKTTLVNIALNKFIAELLMHDLADVKSQIQWQCAENLSIYFDESQLRQVLINLIRNALRHNAIDAPYIKIQIVKSEHSINIDVIDFGSGIQGKDLSHLFQPFFSTEMNGTGLGLYLSHSMCEANQTKLIYVEQKQQGACFRIKCPISNR